MSRKLHCPFCCANSKFCIARPLPNAQPHYVNNDLHRSLNIINYLNLHEANHEHFSTALEVRGFKRLCIFVFVENKALLCEDRNFI